MERYKARKWIHGDRTFEIDEQSRESLLQQAEIGGLETIPEEFRELREKILKKLKIFKK